MFDFTCHPNFKSGKYFAKINKPINTGDFVVLHTASENKISIPENSTQRLIIDNLPLTTEDFFVAYMSSDLEQRRQAEMYLIGVIEVLRELHGAAIT